MPTRQTDRQTERGAWGSTRKAVRKSNRNECTQARRHRKHQTHRQTDRQKDTRQLRRTLAAHARVYPCATLWGLVCVLGEGEHEASRLAEDGGMGCTEASPTYPFTYTLQEGRGAGAGRIT